MILGTVEHVSVYFKDELFSMDGVGGDLCVSSSRTLRLASHIDSLLELFIRPIWCFWGDFSTK